MGRGAMKITIRKHMGYYYEVMPSGGKRRIYTNVARAMIADARDLPSFTETITDTAVVYSWLDVDNDLAAAMDAELEAWLTHA